MTKHSISTTLRLLRWEMVLLTKYGIMPVAIGIGVAYIGVIYLLDVPSELVQFLIFTDPAMMGFLFIGVMVLFEKQAGTNTAIVVTPMLPWQYLISKSIALTIPALFVSIAMGIAAEGNPSLILIAISVSLTSVLFLLLGFVGALSVKTFNEYIMVIPLYLFPLCIPIVAFFGLWDTPLMWLIPTHASLRLLQGAFSPICWWEVVLSITILSASIFGAWRWATHSYRTTMSNANTTL